MINISEKKEFVYLHAVAQGMNLKTFKSILNKISNDSGDGIGDWCYEFSEAASKYFDNKDYANALHYYNLARFPYIDSVNKKDAYLKCLTTFDMLCIQKNIKVDNLSVEYKDVQIPLYLYRSNKKNAPLILVIGGIVSIKEQWYQFLLLGKKLGFSVALIDFPGVGANSCCYDKDCVSYIEGVLNILSTKVNINNTHCVAMSFGGHLILQAATKDLRIKSITTVGAPLYYFFKDIELWKTIPTITKKTLQRIMQIDEDKLFNTLNHFALENDSIKQIVIPTCYLFSNNDEIISMKDKDYMLKNFNNLMLYSFDDKHGSPNHMQQIKIIILYSLLKFSHHKIFFSLMLGLKIRIEKLRGNVSVLKIKSRSV